MEQISASEVIDRLREAREYARQREEEALTAHDPADSSLESLMATVDGVAHRVVADVLDVVLRDNEEEATST
ncbi:hypothetical protein GCM10022403_038960 [Streptomyces coacervatus]|uniref:Uncharacterized protein n=1 Tax=Streptomyces coacervatus TaxID=647381 RepID=A0ABP7HUW0_9ACTN|nr:hypothetical protein [Streptomyces coacervatus]MDF2270697.1 hypothetical protein [Streptomyces coacervatus]